LQLSPHVGSVLNVEPSKETEKQLEEMKLPF